MLKRPSVIAPLRPPSAAVATAMEVESTRVETLPDGKKLIDVTMRRTHHHSSVKESEKLVVPQFDDDDSSSSSDDDEDGVPHHYESPVKKSIMKGRDEEEDEDENNNTTDVRQSVAGFQGEFQWTGVQDIQALTHTNAALQEQVAELKAQLKTTQIQLEALAPVPGLNASAIQDILLDKDGTEHDIRDTKIVHQAKTLRHLKRSLQREKQLASDAVKQCKTLEAHAAALEKENDTLKLKLARFQARATAAATPAPVLPPSQDDGGPQTAGETTTASAPPGKEKESVSAYKKKYEDMRIRHDKLLADLKKTQRALIREVGEDVSLDELIDGSGGNGAENARRGRAQQIIMLKAKVKKLEQDLTKGAADPSTTGSTSVANGDVDQRAMQDLSVLHTQKQRVIDKLTAERDELLERHQQLTKKFDALRSRTQTLEKEKQDHKGKLQVLVDKSRNDDALVDALQRQLETWKGKLQEVKRARTAESSSLGSGGASGGLPKDERLELDRLRALVADFKRQQSTNQTVSSRVSSGFMPPPSEAAQYRAITAEKERLVEQVKVLQSQLEDKDRQLRASRSASESNSTTNQPLPVSRIPRLGSGSLPTSQYFPTPPPATVANDTSALEAQKRSFRDAMAGKEQEIEALKQHVQQLTQQQSASAMQQEIQDLNEENEYLRQEFDRLKTRYEAMRKSSHKC